MVAEEDPVLDFPFAIDGEQANRETIMVKIGQQVVYSRSIKLRWGRQEMDGKNSSGVVV